MKQSRCPAVAARRSTRLVGLQAGLRTREWMVSIRDCCLPGPTGPVAYAAIPDSLTVAGAVPGLAHRVMRRTGFPFHPVACQHDRTPEARECPKPRQRTGPCQAPAL